MGFELVHGTRRGRGGEWKSGGRLAGPSPPLPLAHSPTRLSAPHPRPRRLTNEVHQRLRRGTGKKDLPDAQLLQRLDVFVGNNPSGYDQDVFASPFAEEPENLGEEQIGRASCR